MIVRPEFYSWRMLNRLPVNERRAQLVESALNVAERGGIASVTIRAVAEQAGVSLGVVHYCFGNKEALLAAMGEAMVLQLSVSMRYSFGEAAGPSDPRGVRGLRILIHSGFSSMWPLIEATPQRQMLTYELTSFALRNGAHPEFETSNLTGAIASDQYRTMDGEMSAFLDECARRAGVIWLEPLPAITRFSLALLDGLVLRWLVDRNSDAMLAQLDDMAGLVAAKAAEV